MSQDQFETWLLGNFEEFICEKNTLIMNRTEILAVPTRLLSSASALAAVSLTHIRYKTGDIFGWIMGWFSLLPIFIAFGGFSTLLLFRRELQTFFFAFGLLISETTNQVHRHKPLNSNVNTNFTMNLRPSNTGLQILVARTKWLTLYPQRHIYVTNLTRH